MISTRWIQLGLMALIVASGVHRAESGTAYTWTNTAPDSASSWNTAANWSPAGGPPGSIASDSAYLTNSIQGRYTCRADASIANSLNTLYLYNTLGEAWLVLTNGVLLTTANFAFRNGGRMEIDEGSCLWTATGTAVGIGSSASHATGLVTSATAAGGTWNLNGQNLVSGSSGNSNALTINKASLTNLAEVYVGYNGGDTLNTLTISNGCLFASSGFQKSLIVGNSGSSTPATSNTCYLGGLGDRVTVTNLRMVVGASSSASGRGDNTLVMTNATIINGGENNRIGDNSSYNRIHVMKDTLWNANGQWFHMSKSQSDGNELVINGGTLTNVSTFALTYGAGSYFCHDNKVVITNGGKLYVSAAPSVGNYGYSNSLTIAGSGSLFHIKDTSISIGQTTGTAAPTTGNFVRVSGGKLMACGNIDIGNNIPGAVGNTLFLDDGGEILLKGNDTRLTLGGTTNAVANAAYLGGAGALSVVTNYALAVTVGLNLSARNTLTITNAMVKGSSSGTSSYIGNNSSSNTMNIMAGGSYSGIGGFFEMGVGASTGNVLNINGGLFATASRLYVGRNAGNCGNQVTVTNGGVLEAAWLNCNDASGTGNSITNCGGVFQFIDYNPTISPNPFGTIVINGGSVSFRGIANADVFCNGSGKALDSASKLAWAGKNAFRLNSATNNSTGQAYTFADSGSPTNFVRLELLNNSLYRGGAVTIGDNGGLTVSNGVSTVGSNLTFSASSTLTVDLSSTNAFGGLVVDGNVALNGCTLAINPGSAPVPGSSFQILSNRTGSTSGSFGTASQLKTVNNTNYIFRISTSATGASVTCGLQTLGTRIVIE